MEITQNQFVASILILLLIWICFTWDSSIEKFTENNPGVITAQKWGQHYYYNLDDEYPIIAPSIAVYDDSNYKFSEKALKTLKSNEKRRRRSRRHRRFRTKHHRSEETTVPVPQNVHSGQTEQVGGPENVVQPGANLQEVMEQEMNIMHPGMIRDDESVLHDLHELPLQEQLPQHYEHRSESNNMVSDELMPGMQQKAQQMEAIQQPQNKIIEMPIVDAIPQIPQQDNKAADQFNLSLATLMSVLLVGFMYYSKN